MSLDSTLGTGVPPTLHFYYRKLFDPAGVRGIRAATTAVSPAQDMQILDDLDHQDANKAWTQFFLHSHQYHCLPWCRQGRE